MPAPSNKPVAGSGTGRSSFAILPLGNTAGVDAKPVLTALNPADQCCFCTCRAALRVDEGRRVLPRLKDDASVSRRGLCKNLALTTRLCANLTAAFAYPRGSLGTGSFTNGVERRSDGSVAPPIFTSVGRGAVNAPGDVFVVQSLLNDRLPKPHAPVPVNGVADIGTTLAIETYQAVFLARCRPRAPIDPGSATYIHLPPGPWSRELHHRRRAKHGAGADGGR